MPSSSLSRKGIVAVAVAAGIAAAFAAIDRFVVPMHRCERCGERMRAFKFDDFDWVGGNIYECRNCGFMVDLDAWSLAQRLWAEEMVAVEEPSVGTF